MKKLFLLFCLVSVATHFNAQWSRTQSELLKVEWQKELKSGYPSVSGIVLADDKIYVTQTGDQEGSSLNIMSLNGDLLFNSTTDARIRSFFKYDNALYSMGDERITKRDWLGNIVEEKMLPLSENGRISSRNGKILHGRVYTTHLHSYFLKFSLDGEQLFKKIIGSCDNHMLDVGGNFIYVCSTINPPSQDFRLMQYDTLGNQKWSVSVGGVTNIFTDEAGNCYAISYASGNNSFLSKYTVDGELSWTREIPGQWTKNGTISGNKIYLAGLAIPTVNENTGGMVIIMKLDTGDVLGKYVYDLYPDGTDEGYGEQFTHIAIDGDAIYAGGFSGIYPKSFLVKLSREGSTTGIKDAEATKTSFNIFPNPGGTKFTITCENGNSSPLDVIVRNISGQVVFNREINCNADKSYTLDLGKQPAGNYSVEIDSPGGKTVKKVLVE